MFKRVGLAIVVAVLTYIAILIIAALLALIPEAAGVVDVLRRFGWIIGILAGFYYYFTGRTV